MEAQGIGCSLKQGVSEAPDTTLCPPLWAQSHCSELCSPFVPFSILQVTPLLLPPLLFWTLDLAAISMPVLCLHHHSGIQILKIVHLIEEEREFIPKDLFLSNTFPSFFFCYFQLIIFAHVQLQINLITDRFHISLNQKGHL